MAEAADELWLWHWVLPSIRPESWEAAFSKAHPHGPLGQVGGKEGRLRRAELSGGGAVGYIQLPLTVVFESSFPTSSCSRKDLLFQQHRAKPGLHALNAPLKVRWLMHSPMMRSA
ncbi:unnamed protein product [Symbiodinium sp. CCMP2592]|nr:unnamed protein product [Symbiodinium sp. CCMP2592]